MAPSDPRPDSTADKSLIQGKTWLTKKLADLIFTSTPNCREMTRLISQAMDRSLPWSTRIKMRVHYLACCYCHNYQENLHYISRLLRWSHRHTEEISRETLPEEAKERIKEAIRSGDL